MRHILKSQFEKGDRVTYDYPINSLSSVRKCMYLIKDGSNDKKYTVTGTVRNIMFSETMMEFIYLVEFYNQERIWISEKQLKKIEDYKYEDNIAKAANSI